MPSRTSERVILLVLAAIQFTHIMDFMVMMPLAPQLMRELNLGAGHSARWSRPTRSPRAWWGC
jgi:predicted MFS family arabinose efflux permease